MNESLISRITMQLDPILVQEFIVALAEDEKKIKALEIIKKKNVDIEFIKSHCDLIEYNKRHRISLSQKEFNLLKEVLENA